jgi:hypothetical protein
MVEVAIHLAWPIQRSVTVLINLDTLAMMSDLQCNTGRGHTSHGHASDHDKMLSFNAQAMLYQPESEEYKWYVLSLQLVPRKNFTCSDRWHDESGIYHSKP